MIAISGWPDLFLRLASWLFLFTSAQTQITTQLGLITGQCFQTPLACRYLGIPYAVAPLGDFRFAPPVDWTTTYPANGLNATTWGASCIGAGSGVPESEDCLFLNVMTPLNTTNMSALPVLVWFYGGGFVSGSSTFFDARPFVAANNVIFVSLNYRLASFGFLALQETLELNPQGGTGNWGLLDQQSALRWVNANIKSFGGDPSHVMIFGESAGAISVNLQLILTGSLGLFQAAGMESGFPSVYPLEFALRYGKTFGARANCSGIEMLSCLRKKSVEELVEAQGNLQGNSFTNPNFGPVVDKVIITDNPYTLFASRKWAQIPVLAGTNTDEGTLFVYNFYPSMNDTIYKQYVYDTINSQLLIPYDVEYMEKIYAMYPPSGNNNSTQNLVSASFFTGDYTFICGTRRFLRRAFEGSSNSNLYLYRFDHLPCVPIPNMGIYHTAEIPFVFNNPTITAGTCVFSAQDQLFATQLGSWWSQLGRTGNPNFPLSPIMWPRYLPNTDQDLYLNNQFHVEVNYRKSFCDFWDNLEKDSPNSSSPSLSLLPVGVYFLLGISLLLAPTME